MNIKKMVSSKLFIVTVAIAVLLSAGYWFYSSSSSAAKEQYRFTAIERGNLESIVSSTGTLSAVTTVQVGSQVSGTISKLFVDFNSKVRKGQLIALIDTTILLANFKDAQISLDRAKAQLEQSDRDFERMKTLYEKSLAAQSDYDLSKYNNALAKAAVKSARLSLERAKTNLDYAYIKAPIDGTVIARNIDVGQTVAANFSAPTLFLIANDLSKMQILASVDESDIGQIKTGQKARFTVQAYPEKKFEGVVDQIRLSPSTIQNVVNYTVVVNVNNKEGLLLPGMTATVDFLIQSAYNVLKVSNSALRFRPTPEMLAQIRKSFEERAKNLPDSLRNKIRQRIGQGGGNGGERLRGFFGGNNRGAGSSSFGQLWYLDENHSLKIVPVRLGITDGQNTEIILNTNLASRVKEGMQVINGVLTTEESTTGNTSPFGNNNNGRRGGVFLRSF